MRIAVTGASGFVGGAVCRALAGHQVYAFGRRVAQVPGAVYRRWDITAGTLTDAPAVDAVIHCAGAVTDWAPAHEFFATHVDGTRNVLASFPEARFVHVSTASVYDPFQPTVMATEDLAPVRRYVNAYGASKAAAERLVRKAMAHRPAVILRPHAVYGPGDPALLPRVLSAVRGRRLLAVGDGRQRLSLTSVANLARGCVLAACGPVERGIFNITDASPLVLDEALRAILAERAIEAEPVYLPRRALWPIASVTEAMFRLAHSKRRPLLTRYAVSHLAVERTLDITAARVQLRYEPTPTSFEGAAAW